MKKLTLIFALCLLLSNKIYSQPGFDNYHFRNDFLMASPGAMKFGLSGHRS